MKGFILSIGTLLFMVSAIAVWCNLGRTITLNDLQGWVFISLAVQIILCRRSE